MSDEQWLFDIWISNDAQAFLEFLPA